VADRVDLEGVRAPVDGVHESKSPHAELPESLELAAQRLTGPSLPIRNLVNDRIAGRPA
jgi:hypothetical protein